MCEPLQAMAIVACLAAAQRVPAKFEWQGRAVVVDYGKVSVGKHTLDELRPGETWRMGSGAITTLLVEAPLITDDTVVPPGHYRTWVARYEERKFALQIDGAGRWMAAGGDHVTIPATFTLADPPSKALEVALDPGGEQVDPEARALGLTVTFGSPRLTAPFSIVGSVRKKVGGATVDWFKLPTEWLVQRLELAKHTPIAAIAFDRVPAGEPQRFNLLLSDHDARLVPQETPPTADNGFGPLAESAAAFERVGTVIWSEAPLAPTVAGKPDPAAHVIVDEITLDRKKSLRLVARAGNRRAEVVVPFESSGGADAKKR